MIRRKHVAHRSDAPEVVIGDLRRCAAPRTVAALTSELQPGQSDSPTSEDPDRHGPAVTPRSKWTTHKRWQRKRFRAPSSGGTNGPSRVARAPLNAQESRFTSRRYPGGISGRR